MAFTRCGVVLALFCGIASASWGPHDLVVDVGDNKGDYVDLKLQWQSGSCPFAWYEIYVQGPDGNEVDVGQTSALTYVIQDQEFWTNYTVILKTSYCFDFESLSTEITTGPGNPHKVQDIKTEPSATGAAVTVTEAAMPYPVGQYNVTLCSSRNCTWKIIPRDENDVAGTLNLNVTDLAPLTKYNLSVVAEILYESKKYLGPAAAVNFTTTDVVLPVPTEIKATFDQNDQKPLEVVLTWKLKNTTYQLSYYNVTISCDTDASYQTSRIVKENTATFTAMPNSAKLTATVLPFFTIANKSFNKSPGVFKFNTPDAEPKPPTNFQYASLDNTTVFAKWTPPINRVPDAVNYTFTYTDPHNKSVSKTVNQSAQITLTKLASNTTYTVVITVISKKLGEAQLNATFTTLPEDYAAPQNINISQTTKTANNVSYNLTWTASAYPVKQSGFQIQYCDVATKACTVNNTADSKIVLPFGYFAKYDITVSAWYTFNITVNNANLTVTRSAKIPLTTIGTEPVPVTNFKTPSVNTNDITLTWDAPANVPKKLSKTYKISDSSNTIGNLTAPSESITIKKLAPYQVYNVSVATIVNFNNTDYKGNQSFVQVRTDAAAPGAPKTVQIKQWTHQNVFEVFWTAPESKNGALNYYLVKTVDSAKKMISNLTIVSQNSTTVTLPGAYKDANYTVSVTAVNINLKNQHLPGPAKDSIFAFKGVGTPIADVVGRTSNSLIFKLSPNKSNDANGIFYILKNSKNEVYTSTSPQVEVKNLTTFHNETVTIQACYLDTFCSDTIQVTHQTNVGAPSEVSSLVPHVDNKTSPYFNWTEPTTKNGNLDGYAIYLEDLTNPNRKISKVLPSTQLSFEFYTNDEFETFNFTVKAFNNDLDQKNVPHFGKTSNVSVQTTGFKAPKPEKLHQVNETSTSAVIQWEKPNFPDFKITCFLVQINNESHVTNQTSYAIQGLTPWTNTTVLTSSCTSEDKASCGLPRTYIVQTAMDAPSKPNNVTQTDITTSEAVVHWEKPSNPNGPINGYKIAISTGDNQTLEWLEVDNDVFQFNVTNLTASSTYTAHIIAYNFDEKRGDLDSEIATSDFTTQGTGSATIWIIVVLSIVVIAAAVAGVLLYRKRNAMSEDREHLVHA